MKYDHCKCHTLQHFESQEGMVRQGQLLRPRDKQRITKNAYIESGWWYFLYLDQFWCSLFYLYQINCQSYFYRFLLMTLAWPFVCLVLQCIWKCGSEAHKVLWGNAKSSTEAFCSTSRWTEEIMWIQYLTGVIMDWQ